MELENKFNIIIVSDTKIADNLHEELQNLLLKYNNVIFYYESKSILRNDFENKIVQNK